MVKWLNITIFCGLFVNCISYIQPQKSPHLIRVAIITGLDSVNVSGIKGEQYLENYKIKLNDNFPVFLKPFENKVKVNNKFYYGNLEIKKMDNKIWVINVLDIEDYLKGVVPCEIGKINPRLIEAAKAQTIAARTYAYSHLNQYANLGFDLYATVKDQVYQGISVEDTLINSAISKTKSLVLTYQGKPIDAKYHSTCGGYTADFNDAWNGNPVSYLKSVKCGFCNDSPHSYWKKEFNKKDFFKILRKNLYGMGIAISDTELIRSLKFKRNIKSKRIVEVIITTDKKDYKIPAYNIRRLFGSEKDPGGLLKSSNFNIYIKDNKIILEGKGYGHGVGMCQFGAMGMAKNGKNFKEILKHYYPGTKISRF
ncbi:MAG: SpoIID/LytB domain-containing protein [candidate division WOR-3 bacterium]